MRPELSIAVVVYDPAFADAEKLARPASWRAIEARPATPIRSTCASSSAGVRTSA
jgi:hypothetical protein